LLVRVCVCDDWAGVSVMIEAFTSGLVRTWPCQRPLGCDEAWTRRNVTRSHSYVSHLVVVTRGARLGSEHMVQLGVACFATRPEANFRWTLARSDGMARSSWIPGHGGVAGTRPYATGRLTLDPPAVSFICALSTGRFQLSAG